MRIKDIRKVGSYLKRLAKDPFSKQSRSALKRYIVEGFVLISEKIRGLDFTMVYQCESNKHNNNYSKSPKHILKKMFDDIDFSQKHGFMDVGCGKGYVMALASEYPFKKVCGIEYTKELCDIARKNFHILDLNQTEVLNCDAREYTGYADYDIYYFCNPFDETILSIVAKKIFETHHKKNCFIYYLNPHQEERQRAITMAGFKLIKIIKDKNEKYFDMAVYSNLIQ